MYFNKIRTALESGLLSKSLCEIVPPPTKQEISELQNSLSSALTQDHTNLLLEWGGSNLDEIRINGIDNIIEDNGLIEFANDYDGNVFKYNQSGNVFAFSTDGGEEKILASSVDEFINEVLLGRLGSDFYGEDWITELEKHKLI